MRHLALILAMAACGGDAADEHPVPGWCCDGLCGLWAEDAEAFDTCTCEAPERATSAPGRGECLAAP